MSRLRALRGAIAYSAGPVGYIARRLRPRAAVLVYHRVATVRSDPYGLTVSPSTFERHLRMLKERWTVVPLEELVTQLPSAGYRDGSVAVTFDDGYADNLEVAAPIAARLQVPVTVFVTATPVLEQQPLFWWDVLAHDSASLREELHPLLRRASAHERSRIVAELAAHQHPGQECGRPMTVAELLSLASVPEVTIGAHTLTHPSLSSLPRSEQYEELRGCKDRLESALGRPINLVSYPFGQRTDVSSETMDAAGRAGYVAAFTATARAIVPSARRHALSRMIVHDCYASVLASRLHHVLREA